MANTLNHDTDPTRALLPQAPAEDAEIVTILEGYREEAEQNRRGGLNPRDLKWEDNLNLYWNRWDFSGKAPWQAQETLPEVPAFVDRFAGALKEALMQGEWYGVYDPADKEHDLTKHIKSMVDVWLSVCGRNQSGNFLDFSSVFEEQMQLGALMMCSSVVLWKGDRKHGRVAIESVDPRFVWFDHTYRNLYRIRRIELDKHELKTLKGQKDGKGKPIYNLEELDRMAAFMLADDRRRREEASGTGQEILSTREPIVLEEYIATVVNNEGKVLADRALIVIANREFLVRGPEKNPFWHGKDWMVAAPLVTAPLSVYGRTYMEDFGSVAGTFNELTNLILDAVRTSAMRAYAVVPGMLLNPAQVAEGLAPNKLFLLDEGNRAQDFAHALELGQMPAEVMGMWNALKNELREAASINEVGLGQFAPKGRTSATEIAQTQQSSSALIRSIAQSVESRWLNPTLDLVWKTGLQHVSTSDPLMQAAVGQEMYGALMGQRKELASRPITFQARGISATLQKSQALRALLTLMSVLAQSEPLMQAFLQEVDLKKLLNMIFRLSNVDISELQMTEREALIKQAAQPIQQAQDQAAGARPPAAAKQVGQQAARSLGIQKAA